MLESFDQLDLGQLPDVHSLESDRLQILWALAAVKTAGIDSATAAEVSDLLRDHFGIAVSRQRVTVVLNAGKGKAFARIGRKSPARFILMRAGENELLSIDAAPLFIDPEKALTGIRQVEGIFQLLDGDLLICDTYVDSKTLDYFSLAEGASSIKLLTQHIQGTSRFRRDLAAFAKQYKIPVEVRQTGGLHDRYVIYPSGMLLLGSSIKDIGKKQSIVVRLPSTFGTEMATAFGRAWSAAAKFV